MNSNQSNSQSNTQTSSASSNNINNTNNGNGNSASATNTGALIDFKNYPNSHWYFTKEQILKHYGDDVKSEITSRQASCAFIQDLGIKLKLSQLIIATATTYFHRFFIRHHLKEHDRFVIATTCLFLAGKVEEKPRKLLDVSYYSYRARYKNSEIGQNSPEVEELANKIVQNEHLLLTTISFELTVEHPYKYLLEYMKMIQGTKNLCQVAWNFVNDSLRTNLCLRYPPEFISYASIFLATKFLSYPLSAEGKKQWWEVLNIKLEVLEDISNQILDLYESTSNLMMKSNQHLLQLHNNNNNGNSSTSPNKKPNTHHQTQQQQQPSSSTSTPTSKTENNNEKEHEHSHEKIPSPLPSSSKTSTTSTPKLPHSSSSASSKVEQHSPSSNSYQSPSQSKHQTSLSPGGPSSNRHSSPPSSSSSSSKSNRFSPYKSSNHSRSPSPSSKAQSPTPSKHGRSSSHDKRDTRDNRDSRENRDNRDRERREDYNRDRDRDRDRERDRDRDRERREDYNRDRDRR